jgi:hypothetical protein
MKIMALQNKGGFPFEIYPSHTHLALLAYALLPQVNNLQFYPI